METQTRELIEKWRTLAQQNDAKGEIALYVARAQRACASDLEDLLARDKQHGPGFYIESE